MPYPKKGLLRRVVKAYLICKTLSSKNDSSETLLKLVERSRFIKNRYMNIKIIEYKLFLIDKPNFNKKHKIKAIITLRDPVVKERKIRNNKKKLSRFVLFLACRKNTAKDIQVNDAKAFSFQKIPRYLLEIKSGLITKPINTKIITKYAKCLGNFDKKYLWLSKIATLIMKNCMVLADKYLIASKSLKS
tara:strand:- start:249 stop:815 length:567 start_codon:yes stop_codon:yes gene_type:complete